MTSATFSFASAVYRDSVSHHPHQQCTIRLPEQLFYYLTSNPPILAFYKTNHASKALIANGSPFVVSSPGKVIVFGEHVAVYGEPAIAAAISLRTSSSPRSLNSGAPSL
ncbi:hypothetical protein V498_09101 [Pseudogymnoascus sp. VKM F-4517 (FW-2822)]|nr:hypothetical protein V498_09101 [Pseudogymnoascus sp. VKM F-4517 (FW-2822)]